MFSFYPPQDVRDARMRPTPAVDLLVVDPILNPAGDKPAEKLYNRIRDKLSNLPRCRVVVVPFPNFQKRPWQKKYTETVEPSESHPSDDVHKVDDQSIKIALNLQKKLRDDNIKPDCLFLIYSPASPVPVSIFNGNSVSLNEENPATFTRLVPLLRYGHAWSSLAGLIPSIVHTILPERIQRHASPPVTLVCSRAHEWREAAMLTAALLYTPQDPLYVLFDNDDAFWTNLTFVLYKDYERRGNQVWAYTYYVIASWYKHPLNAFLREKYDNVSKLMDVIKDPVVEIPNRVTRKLAIDLTSWAATWLPVANLLENEYREENRVKFERIFKAPQMQRLRQLAFEPTSPVGFLASTPTPLLQVTDVVNYLNLQPQAVNKTLAMSAKIPDANKLLLKDTNPPDELQKRCYLTLNEMTSQLLLRIDRNGNRTFISSVTFQQAIWDLSYCLFGYFGGEPTMNRDGVVEMDPPFSIDEPGYPVRIDMDADSTELETRYENDYDGNLTLSIPRLATSRDKLQFAFLELFKPFMPNENEFYNAFRKFISNPRQFYTLILLSITVGQNPSLLIPLWNQHGKSDWMAWTENRHYKHLKAKKAVPSVWIERMPRGNRFILLDYIQIPTEGVSRYYPAQSGNRVRVERSPDGRIAKFLSLPDNRNFEDQLNASDLWGCIDYDTVRSMDVQGMENPSRFYRILIINNPTGLLPTPYLCAEYAPLMYPLGTNTPFFDLASINDKGQSLRLDLLRTLGSRPRIDKKHPFFENYWMISEHPGSRVLQYRFILPDLPYIGGLLYGIGQDGINIDRVAISLYHQSRENAEKILRFVLDLLPRLPKTYTVVFQPISYMSP